MGTKRREKLVETARRREFVLQRRKAGDNYREAAEAAEEKFGADALPKGWGMEYAHKDVTRMLRKVRDQAQEEARQVRELELQRLDAMFAGIWEDATAGDVDAVNSALRVMKRRARMLGLDEPERFEQVVSLVQSEEYARARAAIMNALQDFPEARSAVVAALDDLDADA